MAITRETVEHVEALARLELSEAERERMAAQLSRILDYIEKLNQLDTSEVEPMAQVQADGHPEESLRADENTPGLERDEALGQAPDRDQTYLKVPKVIER